MIIIIELTRLQVELKAKIKYSIAAINSSHFRCSTICHNIFGFDTPFVLKQWLATCGPRPKCGCFSNFLWAVGYSVLQSLCGPWAIQFYKVFVGLGLFSFTKSLWATC